MQVRYRLTYANVKHRTPGIPAASGTLKDDRPSAPGYYRQSPATLAALEEYNNSVEVKRDQTRS